MVFRKYTEKISICEGGLQEPLESLDIWSNDSFLQLADMIMYKE